MLQETLPLIYRDQHLVVVDKPANLLVHPSEIDRRETRSAMMILRDQLEQWVYPVHRLDRPTSGLLVFALNRDIARALATAFEERRVRKDYLAVVRGHPPLGGIIRHALTLKDDRQSRRTIAGEAQEALTLYHRLARVTVDWPVDGRYPTSRYALLRCRPATGRRHQLRRHLKHISHPIIGDSTYGKGPHNRAFADSFGDSRLYLHASGLSMPHPASGQQMHLQAPVPEAFQQVFDHFGWPAMTC
ncbi:pseudouridine synthase [Marinobacter zhanjiangensis]|uniref:tRNA pseudouridine synthase C n=1 Tax=Marinobacter zhanjiangensis TaxID=578215 RepID=A0ABQ3AKB3_9GAMM|nr:pseudouridine synthase [Marinobacter zhanjiangensis]GGY58217.1 tRNA pseudouridine synthase TruC [Marinobacter zhanjiangensis]